MFYTFHTLWTISYGKISIDYNKHKLSLIYYLLLEAEFEKGSSLSIYLIQHFITRIEKS